MGTGSKIFILSHSVHHNSRLMDLFPGQRLSWALDIDGLLKEVAGSKEFSTAIIELRVGSGMDSGIGSVIEDCEKVFQLAICNASNTNFFAIGSDELRPWLPLIRNCGFSGYFPAEKLPDLKIPIERQQQIRGYAEDTIEERVHADLPWSP
jgi:hypothetical protein